MKVGDILQCREEYLVHQCHCCDVAPVGGLAEKIFLKYPTSNTYHTRYIQSQRGIPLAPIEPGTVGIYEVATASRPSAAQLMYVINMYAQNDPGPPCDQPFSKDSSSCRLELFNKCLNTLSSMDLKSSFKQHNPSLAFPWRIGCGIAKGDWKLYFDSIVKFCTQSPNYDVVIYQMAAEGQPIEGIPLPQGHLIMTAPHAPLPSSLYPASQQNMSQDTVCQNSSNSAPALPPKAIIPTQMWTGMTSEQQLPQPKVVACMNEDQVQEAVEKERSYWKFIVRKLENDHREQMVVLQRKFKDELQKIQNISEQQVVEIKQMLMSVSSELSNEQEQRQKAMEAKVLAQQKLAEGIKKLEEERRQYQNQIQKSSCVPEYWSTDFAFISHNRHVLLDHDSEEYRVVASLMCNFREIGRTKKEKDDGFFDISTKYLFDVTQIERVENRELWDAYCYERQKLVNCYRKFDAKEHGAATSHLTDPESRARFLHRHESLANCELCNHLTHYPMLTPCHDGDPENPVNEYWLFHGTDSNTIDKYLTVAPGYDPRMGGGLFGHGFYLAEDPRKSFLYTKCGVCKSQNKPCLCFQARAGTLRRTTFNAAGVTLPRTTSNAAGVTLRRTSSNAADVTEETPTRMLVYRAMLGNAQVVIDNSKADEMGKLMKPKQDVRLDIPYDSILVECMSNVQEASMLFREIILYEKFKAYPEYIVTFQRRLNDGGPRRNTITLMLDKAKAFITRRNRILNAESK